VADLSDCVFAINFVCFPHPEPGGKSLEGIDLLFTRTMLAYKTFSVEDLEENANFKVGSADAEMVMEKFD